jgi:hypothetical protein
MTLFSMNKWISVFIFIIFLIATACTTDRSSDPQYIIDRSIGVHGGSSYLQSEITFTFRDIDYLARRENGLFSYERRFTDDEGEIHDVLNNDGFTRKINGEKVSLDEEWSGRYQRSVNAVIYFALLPYPLNDPAVRKRYLGMEMIKDQEYHKIEVTFESDGGGKDYEDIFVYWIHPEHYTMDYLAYEFFTDEGGIRFREALNPREVGGIRFADYNNYRPLSLTDSVYEMGTAFNEGRLEMVSFIALEHIEVNQPTFRSPSRSDGP